MRIDSSLDRLHQSYLSTFKAFQSHFRHAHNLKRFKKKKQRKASDVSDNVRSENIINCDLGGNTFFFLSVGVFTQLTML